VPIYCRTPRGAVVVGDVVLDAKAHIVFAPSREELLCRLDQMKARDLDPVEVSHDNG
jgi:hypothetical protein